MTWLILSVIHVTGPALRRPGSFCLYTLRDPKPLGKKSSYLVGETAERLLAEGEVPRQHRKRNAAGPAAQLNLAPR